ncbi:hypothetical protein GCM10022227_26710 [Streptomyces sedi]
MGPKGTLGSLRNSPAHREPAWWSVRHVFARSFPRASGLSDREAWNGANGFRWAGVTRRARGEAMRG